jgi:hypothetical protein
MAGGGGTGEKGKQELIGKHSCWNKDSNGGEGRREINTQLSTHPDLRSIMSKFRGPGPNPLLSRCSTAGYFHPANQQTKPMGRRVIPPQGGAEGVMRHPWLKATPWEP